MRWDEPPVYVSLLRPNRQSAARLKNLLAKLRKLQRGSNLVFINPVVPQYLTGQVTFLASFAAFPALPQSLMLIHKSYLSKVDAAGEQREGTHFDLNLSFRQVADHLIILRSDR